jgi:hypothetical protein
MRGADRHEGGQHRERYTRGDGSVDVAPADGMRGHRAS